MIMKHGSLITNLFLNKQTSTNGLFQIQVYLNGEQKVVSIDD